jgi:DNA polymerase III epsilon subunit-like protein
MTWIIIIITIIIYYLYFRHYNLKNGKRTDLSFLPKQFVVVDIETTGLNPEKHEIIEIGAVKVNVASDNHDTFTTFIRTTKYSETNN